MVAETYSGFIQRYNMTIGVLFFALSTSLMILIFPIGLLFLGDIYLVVGGGIGLYFTFKNIKESQSHIKTGIIVGLTGSVLLLILISFFVWILYSLTWGLDFFILLEYILSFFLFYGLFYIPIGLVMGYLFGNYYRKKERVSKESPLF